jgi:hypothetical protein
MLTARHPGLPWSEFTHHVLHLIHNARMSEEDFQKARRNADMLNSIV